MLLDYGVQTHDDLQIMTVLFVTETPALTSWFSANWLVFISVDQVRLRQKYYALQVRPDFCSSNTWPPDHDSMFLVTKTSALTTWPQWLYMNALLQTCLQLDSDLYHMCYYTDGYIILIILIILIYFITFIDIHTILPLPISIIIAHSAHSVYY